MQRIKKISKVIVRLSLNDAVGVARDQISSMKLTPIVEKMNTSVTIRIGSGGRILGSLMVVDGLTLNHLTAKVGEALEAAMK